MRFLRFISNSGIWAPLIVLVLHELLQSKEWRTQIDWFNHFAGGLSFTFFAWKSQPFVYRWFGRPTTLGGIAVAFLAGCTAALSWEIIEFCSDVFLRTHIQKSIHETMMDIVNGFLGTFITSISLILLYRQSIIHHPRSIP